MSISTKNEVIWRDQAPIDSPKKIEILLLCWENTETAADASDMMELMDR